MRHRARDSGGKFARCAAILVYCLVRDWTRFCYVIGFEKIRIHPSTRYRIRCGYIFSTLESEFKNIRIRCRICRMRVDGSRILKEKVADSKISGYVWTEPKLARSFTSTWSARALFDWRPIIGQG